MPDTIDMGTAAILGAVQGATEFLPVSSSGHIGLTAMLLHVSADLPLSMVVLLHFGTLLATIAFFSKDLRRLTMTTWSGLRGGPREYLATDDGKVVAGIVVASVPTALIGLTLESRVEEYSHLGWVIGLGFFVTAVMLVTTRRRGGDLPALPLSKAFLIGVAQGVAVLPGVSRSGTTIAVAMMLGMSGPAAFRFSFLLSMPAVAGATMLSARHTEELRDLGASAAVGAVVSAVVGFAALLWLRSLVKQGRLWMFAIYVLPLGLGLVGWHVYTLVT